MVRPLGFEPKSDGLKVRNNNRYTIGTYGGHNEILTRVSTLRGSRPKPLDDEALLVRLIGIKPILLVSKTNVLFDKLKTCKINEIGRFRLTVLPREGSQIAPWWK